MKRFSALLLAAAFLLGGCVELSHPHLPPDCSPTVEPVSHEFRVLIIEDVKQREKLPKRQLETLTSKAVRDFLKEKCVKVNGSPDFKVLHITTPLSPAWRATVEKYPAKSYPWMWVTNGDKGISVPLPEVDKFIDIVKPYAN